MTNSLSFPTILVAELDGESRDWLVSRLRQQGYFVLEARDDGEALELVKIHSRPIHLMLTGGGPNARNLAAVLKPYRPKMCVLFVSRSPNERTPDLLPPGMVLDKVQEIIKAPRRAAAAC